MAPGSAADAQISRPADQRRVRRVPGPGRRQERPHAVALDPAGKRLHDAALPNTEAGLRKLFDKLARHGRILAVVDQPASIGALPVAVARAAGHQIAYLPGLVMHRLADLHPGTAKTDARDAYVIADAARTLPHTLRRVDAGDDTLAELEILVGYDDDLAGEVTRISNRIRGLLTQIHPPLERVLGPKVQHAAALELLSRCGGPAGLRKAGRSKLAEIVKPRAPRMGVAWSSRSLLPWMLRPWWFPARRRPRRSCRSWRTACGTC